MDPSLLPLYCLLRVGILKWASPAEPGGAIASHGKPCPYVGLPPHITIEHHTGASGPALVSETRVPVSGGFAASIFLPQPPKDWD